MPRSRSLAVRLGMLFLLLLSLVLVITWVFGRQSARSLTIEFLEHNVLDHTATLAAQMEAGYAPRYADILQAGEMAALFDANGTMMSAAPGAPLNKPMTPTRWAALMASDNRTYYDLTTGTIYGYTMLDNRMTVVVVAVGPEVIDGYVSAYQQGMLRPLAAGLLVVSALSGVGIWFLVGKPIRHITSQAERLRTGDLAARVDADPMFDELKVLADTLNGLAAQQENIIRTLEATVDARTASLREANARLERLNRMKDDFVSNVSHELKTPITSLRLTTRLLGEKPDQSPLYVARLEREIKRLGTLIEDLLTLSRLDQARVDFSPQSHDLNRLVLQYVTDRDLLAKEKGVTLQSKLGELSVPVAFDEGLLGQALSIFMTNAFNYTPQGGTVTVSTLEKHTEGKAWAGLRITDTGLGIPEGEQERIFERFYRGNAARVTREPGTGLGLSIAREIVMRHRGSISVESLPHQGATFTIWLPADTDRSQAAR